MIFPLKQYRQSLLVSAILCTLPSLFFALIFFTVIKVYAAEVPTAVSTEIPIEIFTELPPVYIGSAGIPSEQLFASQMDEYQPFAPLPDPVALLISGPTHVLFKQPMQAIASLMLAEGTPSSSVYPVGYNWEPADDNPVTISFLHNGITSTGTITWATAGIKAISVTATTRVGVVTEPFTVAVSVRSSSISSFQTTSFRYSQLDGTSMRTLVPAQIINGSIQLDYLPTPEITGPSEQGFVGQAFELNAFQNQQFVNGYSFEKPATVTIVYDADGMRSGEERLLTLRRWNGSTWVEVSGACGLLLTYEREPEQNRLALEVCQLGQFALFGAVETIFVPMIQ